MGYTRELWHVSFILHKSVGIFGRSHSAVLQSATCPPHSCSQYRIPRNQLAAKSSKNLAASTHTDISEFWQIQTVQTLFLGWVVLYYVVMVKALAKRSQLHAKSKILTRVACAGRLDPVIWPWRLILHFTWYTVAYYNLSFSPFNVQELTHCIVWLWTCMTSLKWWVGNYGTLMPFINTISHLNLRRTVKMSYERFIQTFVRPQTKLTLLYLEIWSWASAMSSVVHSLDYELAFMGPR